MFWGHTAGETSGTGKPSSCGSDINFLVTSKTCNTRGRKCGGCITKQESYCKRVLTWVDPVQVKWFISGPSLESTWQGSEPRDTSGQPCLQLVSG